jgi:solute carrier family 39 (zinc transporter), member 9
MVHKAPAAFGLTSVLLKQGLSKRTARAHLLLFSLAAPTGAILTWLFARSLGAGAIGNAQTTKWWTGMLLLFSAGTFLYVAMHTMQEADHSPEIQQNGHVNGIGEGRDTQSQPDEPSPRDLLAAILGMVLPLFLQIGHAH